MYLFIFLFPYSTLLKQDTKQSQPSTDSYHISLIHSSVHGSLFCFHFLTFLSNVSMYIYWANWFLFLFDIYRGVHVLVHILSVCLTFWGTARQLQSGYISFYSFKKSMSFHISPYPCQYLLVSVFLIIDLLVAVK